MKKLFLFNFFLISLAVFLLVWLGVKNYPHYGAVKITAELGQSTPLISSLGPEVRTKLGDDYQAVLESPVYFDLRVMPWFNKAEVAVVYASVGQHDLVGLGRHTGPGFSYQVVPPKLVQAVAGGNTKAIFEFNLRDFYQEKNIYRFLLDTSVHQYQPGNELQIKELSVILLR